MSPHLMNQQQHDAPVENFERNSINVVYNFCAIVTMPVEMGLRLWSGTRYHTPVHLIASSVMMVVLPLIFGIAGAVGSMIPFAHVQASMGVLDMWGLSRLFFLGCLIHGIRRWRLMMHPEREKISTFEGPALFFFGMFPKASFWRVRIVYEPAFVFALSILLPNLFIVTQGVGNFLVLSAIALAMKGYVSWYITWEHIRQAMDIANIGPIIADIIENRGTDEDFAKVNVAKLPPESQQQYAKAYQARVISPEASHGS